MKGLLRQIENSEVNNPLLTAALIEISFLQAELREISDIIHSSEIKCEEEGVTIDLSKNEQNEARIEMISNLLTGKSAID